MRPAVERGFSVPWRTISGSPSGKLHTRRESRAARDAQGRRCLDQLSSPIEQENCRGFAPRIFQAGQHLRCVPLERKVVIRKRRNTEGQ